MLRFCFCFLFFLFCICLLLGFWDYDWDWEWSGDWHGSGFKPTYHLLLGCIKDNRWRDCLIFYLIFYYSNYSFNCVSISKGSIKLRLRMYSLCFTIPKLLSMKLNHQIFLFQYLHIYLYMESKIILFVNYFFQSLSCILQNSKVAFVSHICCRFIF